MGVVSCLRINWLTFRSLLVFSKNVKNSSKSDWNSLISKQLYAVFFDQVLEKVRLFLQVQ